MSPRRKKILSTVATLSIAGGLLALAFSKPPQSLSQGSSYGQPAPMMSQPRTFVPPIVVPTDVTNTYPGAISAMFTPTGIGPGLLAGFRTLSGEGFPAPENLKGTADYILLKWADDTVFTKPNLYSVSLTSGTVLVGVKKPSNIGMVVTPVGSVAIYANADVLVSFKDGVMRVANLDGIGDAIKVSFQGNVYAVPPGVEFVGANRPLTKVDLRPLDNLSRRNTQVIKGVDAAIIEFSVESSIEGSALIANLQNSNAGDKERRMLSDVSRMAAVLNHIAGAEGFTK